MSGFYVDVDIEEGGLVRRQAISVSTGPASAGQLVRTNEDGVIDPSLTPGIGEGGEGGEGTTEEPVEVVVAGETGLVVGEWVNLYITGGVRRARRATAADTSHLGGGYPPRPVHGYIKLVAGSDVHVATSGINASSGITGFTSVDVGKPVFLSATVAGACTKTPPSTANQIVQRLGFVTKVDTTVFVRMDFSYIVKV